MSDQTPLSKSNSYAKNGAEPGVANRAASVVHDVTELLDLQIQLLKVDCREVVRRAALPLGSLVVGASLLLGAIPIALLGLTEALVQQLNWSRLSALFTSAGIAVVCALILIGLGSWGLRRGFRILDNSRQELQSNLASIKRALTTGGAKASYPERRPIV